ncbi:MAG: TlpA disulfide reductase family protein [Thioalkalispiraceae bacterium]|jgi:thiol-disulfide isomerase/thioredoxin
MNITKILLIFIFLISSQFIQAESLPINIIPLDKSKAENFIIDDYDGNQYELTSSRGKWVFLHFWASWCGPCRREMPEIYKLQKQLKNKNIDFVLVNTAEDEDTIFSFLGSVSPDLHSYMDRDGQLTEVWQPRGLPTTFFIDPQGRKRYLALGGRPWNKPEYQQLIQRLLAEK